MDFTKVKENLEKNQALLDAIAAAQGPAAEFLKKVAAAALATNQALLDCIKAQTANSAAWVQAVAKAGLGQ